MEALKRQINGSTTKSEKHWCWDKVGVETSELSSSSEKEAVKVVSRTGTKVWTGPLVKRKFIPMDEEWFRKYLTDALCSV